MGVARVKLGLLKHFTQVMNTWGGVELTHVIITEKLDELGQIISQSRVETTIYGLVGNPNFKGNEYPIGFLQSGDLCLTALYSNDIIISDQLTESTTRQDHIIFQNVEYRVENIEIGYDVLVSSTSIEPIICKYLLRKVTI